MNPEAKLNLSAARYAPTPSGSLHLGNLRTAIAAYASARFRGLRFLLRIDDLDRDRCRVEFEEQQVTDLKLLGLDWDDEPLWQSKRDAVYEEHFRLLQKRHLIYPCFCSRKEIKEALSAPHHENGNAYPGTCRRLASTEVQSRLAAGEQHCWRLKIDNAPTEFFDGFIGPVSINLNNHGGDFVIRRADGYFSYQLATAVDDGLSGVSEIVRGSDLLESAVRQAYLLQCLSLPIPRYLHIPLMTGTDGQRLAKRIGSEDLSGFLNRGYTINQMVSYLTWTLGQSQLGEPVESLHKVAERWDWNKIPRDNIVFQEDELKAFPSGNAER